MKFLERKDNGLNIDDSDSATKPIIEAFGTLIEKNGFDYEPIACGVLPSPDLGYFELADRFWRASLCIYSFGATFCFRERGVGYAEPWLFNARHAVESYIKGFLLNAIWLEELQSNPHLSVKKEEINNLHGILGEPHKILEIYTRYVGQITKVISIWNVDEFPETPELDHLMLKAIEMEMLNELNDADDKSFRFRFPSLKQGDLDSLQKINWHHDQSMLFPNTGLPKEAGYFFDHVIVINHLHELINALKTIENYFKGISVYQDVMNDYWVEYLRQFGDEGYGYY